MLITTAVRAHVKPMETTESFCAQENVSQVSNRGKAHYYSATSWGSRSNFGREPMRDERSEWT